MEDELVNPSVPSSTSVPGNIDEIKIITEQDGYSTICPLCNSEVKPFYLNLKNKVVMCENADCVYPFLSDEIQLMKVENDSDDDDDENISERESTMAKSGTTSFVSSVEWADLCTMTQLFDGEDIQSEINTYTATDEDKEKCEHRIRAKKEEEKIREDVANIKSFNKIIQDLDKEDKVEGIRNEKWIKNLLEMQKMSGLPLLKTQEMRKLKKKQPSIGLEELKVDINNTNSISSIKIEISNKNNE